MSGDKLSLEQMTLGITRLRRRIVDLEAYDPLTVKLPSTEDIVELENEISKSLVLAFGSETPKHHQYPSAAQLRERTSEIRYEPALRKKLTENRARSISLLNRAVKWLEDEVNDAQSSLSYTASTTPIGPGLPMRRDLDKVFIVHGHDGAAKAEVARFIEGLDFKAIILHERRSMGRPLISKFCEEAAEADFAVVLMTPDDLGRAVRETEMKSRARQNVVFELGFFVGKLGAARVVGMVKGDIEIPSDYLGVVYISLDEEDWQVRLGRELEAAGFTIDWNKWMRR
jgi:predicted nucleotide-binding protein